ncbi:DUF116 domain-containing protein [candidate division KSB1 bacterium]|nr:DUF116 domain-containing protein [candidate division KSB1 bacterium]
MTESNSNNQPKRHLGDEWKDWTGDFQDTLMDATAGKRIFIGLLCLALLVLGGFAFLIWYFISPRLAQFHPLLPKYFVLVFAALWILCASWVLSVIFTIIGHRHIFIRIKDTEICITALLPTIQRMGRRLGIAPDRISHSFVRVSNALITLAAKPIKPNQLMILLPRCLQKTLRETIVTNAKRCQILVYTVPGGELARKLIKENCPKAIIGVACERDLFSGIRDIIRHVPVIGIPNKRPEGPCKNTSIDLKDLDQAVRTFLGPNVRLIA